MTNKQTKTIQYSNTVFTVSVDFNANVFYPSKKQIFGLTRYSPSSFIDRNRSAFIYYIK